MKNRLIRWMTLLALLAGAIACYFSGMLPGVFALLIVGAVLELMFWGRLVLSERKQD